MTDSTWVRSFDNKGVYTGGKMQADNGFIGDLTGNATSATKAGQDGNGENIADTYLPKAGGAVITGTEFYRTDDSQSLTLYAATAWDKGAQMVLYGKDSAQAGLFALVAHGGGNDARLQGTPAGVLTWSGSTITATSFNGTATNSTQLSGQTLAQILTSAGGIVAQSLGTNGYVKFAGGLVIQWGSVSCANNTTATVSWPISFPNVCLGAVGSVNTGTEGDINSKVFSWSTTQVTVFNGEGSTADVFVVAIGY